MARTPQFTHLRTQNTPYLNQNRRIQCYTSRCGNILRALFSAYSRNFILMKTRELKARLFLPIQSAHPPTQRDLITSIHTYTFIFSFIIMLWCGIFLFYFSCTLCRLSATTRVRYWSAFSEGELRFLDYISALKTIHQEEEEEEEDMHKICAWT